METDNRQQKMAEYIQSLAAIEDCMRPYRESRKELRKNFIENDWLDKDEISLATKAYRMWEQQIDFDDFAKIFEAVETSFIDKEDKDDSAQ
jgi:uncharacterized protein YpbB|tara:strand:- start:1239 stop:1511 length:273 start_codon:yes stop_codon:yes gene_type:complete